MQMPSGNYDADYTGGMGSSPYGSYGPDPSGAAPAATGSVNYSFGAAGALSNPVFWLAGIFVGVIILYHLPAGVK